MANQLKVSGPTAAVLVLVGALAFAASLLGKGWSLGAAAVMVGVLAAVSASSLVLYQHEVNIFAPRSSGSRSKTRVAAAVGVADLVLISVCAIILYPSWG